MSIKISKGILCGSVACAAATLGLVLTAPAQAQPYYGHSGAANDSSEYNNYGYEYGVGGVTVTAPYRHERSMIGAPIERVTASRVVPISDLDLSTRWGVHVLRQRVDRAAASACQQLDGEWTMGLYPVQGSNDADCYARAVDGAMAAAPISYRYEDGY